MLTSSRSFIKHKAVSHPTVECRNGTIGALLFGLGRRACSIRRFDLGAYLIREVWAVALPEAPFQYHTLEKIARARGSGVWGFQADSIIR